MTGDDRPRVPLDKRAAAEATWAEIKRGAGPVGRLRVNTVDGFEAARTAGFTTEAGRHVAVDGLGARSGRRRILPDSGTDNALLEDWTERLERIASKTLMGRRLAVFQGRVIGPLLGQPKRTVQGLAEQYGVTTDRIYKDLERDKIRVARAAKQAPVAYATQTPEQLVAFNAATRDQSFRTVRGTMDWASYSVAVFRAKHGHCQHPWWRGWPTADEIGQEYRQLEEYRGVSKDRIDLALKKIFELSGE